MNGQGAVPLCAGGIGSRAPMLARLTVGALALLGAVSMARSACAQGAKALPEVVVHAADLPSSALSEFDFWPDPASPGGKMVGTPNDGGQLDPPPENDPHVSFKVQVLPAIPYRCWVHMKVGKPKGQSQANLFYVQFTDAIDGARKEILKPGTGDYLAMRGPRQEGWTWVGGDSGDAKAAARLVYFRNAGTVTVRMQAGMEGVGFDQFVLSPARFLEAPPTEAVVAKPK